jgi:hypothetical protein
MIKKLISLMMYISMVPIRCANSLVTHVCVSHLAHKNKNLIFENWFVYITFITYGK